MLKHYALIYSLFLVSCTKDYIITQNQKIKRKQEATEIRSSTHEKDLITSYVPPHAKSWNADIYLVNFNSTQEKKIMKAVEIIKKVIASSEFKERVLNYRFKGKKQFYDHGGLTNEEVYQKILEGAEQMGNTSKNNIMDVELELYTQATSTIGYTYPHTVRIWMNRKYYNRYTPIKVADNLMHEWMHKLGFVHATTWSESRDHSVPYAIGYIVEDLANKFNQ